MTETELAIRVNPAYLADLLQRVLGRSFDRLGEWDVQRLTGGFEVGSAIYRLQGTVVADGPPVSWSLILKVIRPDAQWDDPQGFRYWKREMLAYQSDLLYELPGQVTAPRCYEIQEQPDGSMWIWLEEIQDEQAHPWSLERYAQVARHLGQLNGAYLAGHPLPGETWITHDWMRNYLQHAAPMVEYIRQNPAHPIVQRMLPGISLPLTLAFWDERVRMLEALDGLPQTFCHRDAFGRNLFYRQGQVVAIDWGYAGVAPVGAELAPLIGAAFGLARFPSSQAKELDQACFEGYLEGLRQAGWEPDPRQVRMGYAITLPMRFILGATIGEALPGLLDAQTRGHWEEGLGKPSEEAGASDPGIVVYYQSIAIEALKLMGLGSILRVIGRTVTYAVRLAAKRRGKTAQAA